MCAMNSELQQCVLKLTNEISRGNFDKAVQFGETVLMMKELYSEGNELLLGGVGISQHGRRK